MRSCYSPDRRANNSRFRYSPDENYLESCWVLHLKTTSGDERLRGLGVAGVEFPIDLHRRPYKTRSIRQLSSCIEHHGSPEIVVV